MRLLMSESDIKQAVSDTISHFHEVPVGGKVLGISMDEKTNCILIGKDAEAEKSDQIVIGTSKENQLRFNADGTVTHNMQKIGDSHTLMRLITTYMMKAVNEFDDEYGISKKLREDPWEMFTEIIEGQGFITSLATFMAAAGGKGATGEMKEFYNRNKDLLDGTKWEERYKNQMSWIEDRFEFDYTIDQTINETSHNRDKDVDVDNDRIVYDPNS